MDLVVGTKPHVVRHVCISIQKQKRKKILQKKFTVLIQGTCNNPDENLEPSNNYESSKQKQATSIALVMFNKTKTSRNNKILLHRFEPFGNYHAHVKESLGTVCEASCFTGTELASWCTGDAFVPAHICQLPNHLTYHCPLLLLLHFF
jgi:hypothetical protein